MPLNTLISLPSYTAYAYGSGNYDTTNYSLNGTASAGGTSGGTASGSAAGATTGTAVASGGLLTNTGLDVTLIATFACLLIFIALITKFWKRPAKHNSSAETH